MSRRRSSRTTTSSPKDSCAICGSTNNLQLCAKCLSIAYCGREHQMEHWVSTHKKYCKYIPGTHIKRRDGDSVLLGPDPLDPSATRDRRWGSGQTVRDPILSIVHFKFTKAGQHKVRFCYPGAYTPYRMDASRLEQRQRGFKRVDHIQTPYREEGDKKVKMPSGKYRHIASFTIEELRQMGWDGAMYPSNSLNGQYVPFVCGYDSDPDDVYEEVDISAAKSCGVLGLPPGSGTYMEIAGKNHLVEINKKMIRET